MTHFTRSLLSILAIVLGSSMAVSAAETWEYPTSKPDGNFGGGSDSQDCLIPLSLATEVSHFEGEGTAEKPYLIRTEAELLYLPKYISSEEGKANNAQAKYYRLDADLHMDSQELLTEISEVFTGTFDGNGHYISGLRLNGRGMFTSMNGTIKNLTLTYFRGTDSNVCAPLAYQLYGDITDCSVFGDMNATISGSDPYVYLYLAGIAHEVCGGNIKNCCFKGTFSVESTATGRAIVQVGGIAGLVQPSSPNKGTITGCYADFSYDFDNLDINKWDGLLVGGIAAQVNSGTVLSYDYFACSQTDQATAVNNGSTIDSCGLIGSISDLDYNSLCDEESWLPGVFRPVLKNCPHYTVTKPDGSTGYIDLWHVDAYQPNYVINLDITQDHYDDDLLLAFSNIAMVSGNSATIARLVLDANGDDFQYTPAEGVTATTGIASITLTNPKYATDGKFLPLCLPMSINDEDLPKGAYLLKRVSEDWFETTDAVEPGEPCMLYIPMSVGESFELVSAGKIVNEPIDMGLLKGVFAKVTVTDPYRTLAKGSDGKFAFTQTSGSVKIPVFSAYSDSYCSSKLRIIYDENKTNVNRINTTLYNAVNEWSECSASLNKTIPVNTWVPISVPIGQVLSNLDYVNNNPGIECEKLEKFSVEDDGVTTLKYTKLESTDILTAGESYLIRIPGDTDYAQISLDIDMDNLSEAQNSTLSDRNYTCADSNGTEYSLTTHPMWIPFTLDGSTSQVSTLCEGVAETSYFTINNGNPKLVNENEQVGQLGFNWYITASDPYLFEKCKIVHGDGVITGAEGVVVDQLRGEHIIYDINGYRVTRPSRGLYIIDGRKVRL